MAEPERARQASVISLVSTAGLNSVLFIFLWEKLVFFHLVAKEIVFKLGCHFK